MRKLRAKFGFGEVAAAQSARQNEPKAAQSDVIGAASDGAPEGFERAIFAPQPPEFDAGFSQEREPGHAHRAAGFEFGIENPDIIVPAFETAVVREQISAGDIVAAIEPETIFIDRNGFFFAVEFDIENIGQFSQILAFEHDIGRERRFIFIQIGEFFPCFLMGIEAFEGKSRVSVGFACLAGFFVIQDGLRDVRQITFGDLAIFAQKGCFVFGIGDVFDFFVGERNESIPFLAFEIEPRQGSQRRRIVWIDGAQRLERCARRVGVVEIGVGDLGDARKQIAVFAAVLGASFGGGIQLQELGPIAAALRHSARAFERGDIVGFDRQNGFIVGKSIEREAQPFVELRQPRMAHGA